MTFRYPLLRFTPFVLVMIALAGCSKGSAAALDVSDDTMWSHPALLARTSLPSVSPYCTVGGCSGQLCLDPASQDVTGSCEWSGAYACFHSARCEKQANGRCGWSQTDELRSCLKEAR